MKPGLQIAGSREMNFVSPGAVCCDPLKRNTTMIPFTRREFLRTTALTIAGSVVAPQLLSAETAARHAVPSARLQRLAKGANLCRWFRFTREDADHLGNYISNAEAAMIRALGLRHVRLCLTPKVVMDQQTGAIREENARFVDAAIERLHRADLAVVVDLHNEDREAELNPAWQNAFVRFWRDYAARLKRFDPDLTILEIVNEPVFAGRTSEWNALNARLAAAIREQAPQHTIMTSGADWGGIDGLQQLKPLSDLNVIYSFHCYDPFPFTHQGATWSSDEVKPLRRVPYPSSPEAVAPLLDNLKQHPESLRLIQKYGAERWDKSRLAARFKEGVAWGERHNVPLYCGEFGVFPPHTRAEDRARWFRDFGAVLGENQIGWSVWGWDEGFGLNRKHQNGKTVVDEVVASALGLKTA
jgi:endoglucanase